MSRPSRGFTRPSRIFPGGRPRIKPGRCITSWALSSASRGRWPASQRRRSAKSKTQAKVLGIPAPLDDALAKLWGYSSERGRHIREGAEPTFEEAELVVTMAAAMCSYLARNAA